MKSSISMYVCHVRQSVPRKPTRNLLYQLLQWCKPGKQTAIPISSSLGQNDKAQLPVNIPHSIRWNKNSQRCVFSCLVGIYAPKATTDRRIIYYCTESGQSLAMSKQDRESLIIRFNASMKCNRLLRQEKSTITCHHFRGVSLRQNKRMAPRQILFWIPVFLPPASIQRIILCFSAILSHMNEPATKETDNQCNKKTTNLRE